MQHFGQKAELLLGLMETGGSMIRRAAVILFLTQSACALESMGVAGGACGGGPGFGALAIMLVTAVAALGSWS